MIEEITLRNGLSVQTLGVGTYKADLKVPMDTVIKNCLDAGYRAIDTAEHYGNEDKVGSAVKKSGYNRETLYISSKIWNTDESLQKRAIIFHRSFFINIMWKFCTNYPNNSCEKL